MKRKPVCVDLNPKSVTNDELFGVINPATREWKDGMLIIILFNTCLMLRRTEQTKYVLPSIKILVQVYFLALCETWLTSLTMGQNGFCSTEILTLCGLSLSILSWTTIRSSHLLQTNVSRLTQLCVCSSKFLIFERLPQLLCPAPVFCSSTLPISDGIQL